MAKKKTSKASEAIDCESADLNPKVVEKIRDGGFRLTQSRLKVLQFLSQSKKAFSPTELFSALNQKFKKEGFDRVTVYRILEKFEELEIVHPLGNGQYIYCEHQSCSHEQHFILICTACGRIQEVGSGSQTLKLLKEQLLKEAKFKVQSDSLILQGLCEKHL